MEIGDIMTELAWKLNFTQSSPLTQLYNINNVDDSLPFCSIPEVVFSAFAFFLLPQISDKESAVTEILQIHWTLIITRREIVNCELIKFWLPSFHIDS